MAGLEPAIQGPQAPDGKVIARAEGPAEWASSAFIAYFKNLK